MHSYPTFCSSRPLNLFASGLLVTVFGFCALCPAQAADIGSDSATTLFPDYENTFNSSSPTIQLWRGAKIGGPATGVSGKREDLAYIGVPESTENHRNGPRALAVEPIAPRSESVFTCMFWYMLDEHGPTLQVPLNSGSVLYLLNEDNFELRIGQLPVAPWGTVFKVPNGGPYGRWRDSGRWIFAAFVWHQDGNQLSVYQGAIDGPVTLVRTLNGASPTEPTLPRNDLGTTLEVIGNNYQTDRPLSGRLDNVRHFGRALSVSDLEKIRAGDQQNIPASVSFGQDRSRTGLSNHSGPSVAITPAPTRPSLVNPGFELPGLAKIMTGFSPVTGWKNAGSTYSDSGVENTPDSQSGSWHAYNKGSDDGAYQITGYRIMAGDKITLSWWAEHSGGPGRSSQLVGLIASTNETDNYTAARTLSSLTGALSGNGNTYGPWTQYTLTYTATPADAGLCLGVFFKNLTAVNWAGFDDFVLDVVSPEAGPTGR